MDLLNEPIISAKPAVCFMKPKDYVDRTSRGIKKRYSFV